ncbi:MULTISPECIES: ABC transporter ATP-binding protein [unclassified Paenibacillus]|uniref:ABC transporter ATP-binding protein n=1 Tax=unclassified Paenibacillus TaxID=185978 RepID=UPI0004170E59|nr:MULTISPECIES: ABC transporter ATP-binding protein [unclassified Paenibacillus]
MNKIEIRDLSKCYKIFNKPQDRLKQSIVGDKKKYYKEFWALKNISLNVKKGETFGIVGKNGSGKSTLLQIIARTLSQTSGTVKSDGKIAALLELGSGFNPDFTGKENIYMNGTILGLSNNEIDDFYDEIVNFADIGDYINQPISTYSSGMVVRLAFAVQAIVPKDILIVDEALAVGDELFQKKCFNKIQEFKDSGGTILFVSHSGGTVIELCDRAMLLDSGECLLIGGSKDVVNTYQRLMYASGEKKNEIRNEIIQMQNTFTLSDNLKTSETMYKRDTDFYEELYDPNLKPKDTLRYETKYAEISDVKIVNSKDKIVNILKSGDMYLYKYKVKFYSDWNTVKFGMLIKTISGFELGGCATEEFKLFKKGSEYEVVFQFTPKLNIGTYFLNAGVSAITAESEEVYLDRLIDAAAFKIMECNKNMTAVVDFDITASIDPVNYPTINIRDNINK